MATYANYGPTIDISTHETGGEQNRPGACRHMCRYVREEVECVTAGEGDGEQTDFSEHIENQGGDSSFTPFIVYMSLTSVQHLDMGHCVKL